MLRAPEIILGRQAGRAIDIWSFGFLVFESVTAAPLFLVQDLDGNRFDEETNDEHLIQITDMIQPLPETLLSKWSRRASYYGPNGERLEIRDDDVEEASGGANNDGSSLADRDWDGDGDSSAEDSSGEEVPLATTGHVDTLEERFRAKKPGDVGDEEAALIVNLMRQALQPDAAKRASAAELLQHCVVP